jgi:hypothetical protein
MLTNSYTLVNRQTVEEILRLIEQTDWLCQTRQLLFNSFCIAGLLARGESVIVQTTLPCEKVRAISTTSKLMNFVSAHNIAPFKSISSKLLLPASMLICLAMIISDVHVWLEQDSFIMPWLHLLVIGTDVCVCMCVYPVSHRCWLPCIGVA